ncbi:hypothetical protein [Streptomyces sp. CO7]
MGYWTNPPGASLGRFTVEKARQAARDLLGNTRDLSPRARVEIRRGIHHQLLAARLWEFCLYTFWALSVICTLLADKMERYDMPLSWPNLSDPPWQWVLQALFPKLYEEPSMLKALASILSVIACGAGIGAIIQRKSTLGILSTKNAASHGKSRTIALQCGIVLAQCALAKNGTTTSKPTLLKRVDYSISLLIRELMTAPNDRIRFSGRSHRKKALKHHVRLVAAALQKATLDLDKNPDAALQEAAALAHQICERVSHNRMGALLDDPQMAGLEPVRNREWIRLSFAALLTVGVALGSALLGLPATAQPVVIGMVGLLAFTTVYGHQSPRGLELLDSLRGVQRP